MSDTEQNGAGGIVWTNERRRLGDLAPWPRNPRQIKKAEARRLVESVSEFGQVETLAIGPANEIYNGHQRLNVLIAEHGPAFEVDVRVSSRPLSEKEREKLTVLLHRGATGEWDFDLLANEFDAGELIEWGFVSYELGIVGEVDDPNEQWRGMPEFEQEAIKPYQSVIVHLMTAGDAKDFAALVEQTITEKTKWIYYPRQERQKLRNLRVKSES